MNFQAAIQLSQDKSTLVCQGKWTIQGVSALEKQLAILANAANGEIHIEGSEISELDSSGAWLLSKITTYFAEKRQVATLHGLTAKQLQLYDIVNSQTDLIKQPIKLHKHPNLLHQIGEQTVTKILQTNQFLAFIGEVTVRLLRSLAHLARLQWQALVSIIDDTGFQALPIIGLLTFLIGVVLTYQMGTQLRYYGANIYIVNVTGMAVLREFGPLITAILVAGRTGSAFTAQIGTMKVNEEIDALSTMGLSPIDRLVIPKMIGLLITMPLLIVWADCFGIFGSMVMSKSFLDINYYDFLQRFQYVISVKQYLIGLLKAPAFAAIIASVGCFQGFQVSSSAESVGHQTTRSVVQAIFLIIVIDALFSVIFSWQGI